MTENSAFCLLVCMDTTTKMKAPNPYMLKQANNLILKGPPIFHRMI